MSFNGLSSIASRDFLLKSKASISELADFAQSNNWLGLI